MSAKRDTANLDDISPQIAVRQISRRRLHQPGCWNIAWQVQNLGDEAITLCAAHLPHGKFRSEQRTFDEGLLVPGNANASIEFSVYCREAPGSVVDNAFLILHVEWLQRQWRIFVRFQVALDEAAEPETRTELITAHRVGFSAHSPRARCNG